MVGKMYLIALDGTDSALDWSLVKGFIKAKFDYWWSHIPYVLLIETSLTEEQVTATIRQVTGDVSLLVIETTPEHSEGWLPERSWAWIKRHSQHDKTMKTAAA